MTYHILSRLPELSAHLPNLLLGLIVVFYALVAIYLIGRYFPAGNKAAGFSQVMGGVA